MSFCLPYAYYLENKQKKQKKQLAGGSDAEEPLLNGEAGADGHAHQRSELKETLMLAIPTVFDLLATVLMNVGLLSVTASVYQMMRGAEMLFAAAFAVVFLQRKLNRFHLGGILCCILGITLVGSSSIMSGEGSATQKISQEQMLFGMGLIILSQAVQVRAASAVGAGRQLLAMVPPALCRARLHRVVANPTRVGGRLHGHAQLPALRAARCVPGYSC